MNAQLTQLERDLARISQELRNLEEISVPSAARLLRKSPEWIRQHLPTVIHSRKSHNVRLVDLTAYQKKRILWPTKNGL
jgi:hypothetical protein